MGGGGGPPPCLAEFTKLREDVEKKGLAAKAAGAKHAPREEMCKLITSYAAAEAKWVKFTETGVQSCGMRSPWPKPGYPQAPSDGLARKEKSFSISSSCVRFEVNT